MASTASGSSQPLTDSPTPANNSKVQKIYPAIDNKCSNARQHGIGVFCTKCRGVEMPWGQKLPVLTPSAGPLTHGAPESVISGIEICNPTEIGTMCIILSVQKSGIPINTVKGIHHYMDHFPAAVAASQAVTAMEKELKLKVRRGQSAPQWWDIVDFALQNPHLGNVEFQYAFMKAVGRVVKAQPTIPIHDSENETTKAGDKKYKLSLADSTKLTKSSPRAASKTTWRFCVGSDIEDAIINEPDPSKFFLLRENKDDTTKKDCREYPNWEKFDWTKKNDIEALNKARRQIIRRTDAPIGGSRLPWTVAEKEELMNIVKIHVDQGIIRKRMPWDEVGNELERRFRNRTQKAGTILARQSLIVHGKLLAIEEDKPLQYLRKDRVGAVPRSPAAIAHMSAKFGDIAAMIRAGKDKRQRKRKNASGESSSIKGGDKKRKAAVLEDQVDSDQASSDAEVREPTPKKARVLSLDETVSEREVEQLPSKKSLIVRLKVKFSKH